MIEIALRFDDPSPTSDHALEREIFRILDELDIPATVAVVPYGHVDGSLVPVSKDNVPHLVKAHSSNIIEVAQHGYSHAALTRSSTGSQSEFQDVPIEEQTRRIDEGRRLLEATFSSPIHGFIPPWNTYDAKTVRILEKGGYTYLSAGYPAPLESKPKLRLIPRTSQVLNLRQAYAEALSRFPLSARIIAIMHHYDFHEALINPGPLSLLNFREDLVWLLDRSNVKFTTIGRIAESIKVPQGWAIQSRHQSKTRLHWRLQHRLPKHLLLSHPLWMYVR